MPRPPLSILLVDNGSLEPEATLRLRETAARLASLLGRPVEPVSALHSSTIPAGALGGMNAEILEPALERRLSAGTTDFLILPLFFGAAGLLTDYLPKLVARLQRSYPALRVRIARPVVDIENAADERVAEILETGVRALIEAGTSPPSVIVVDHGSPARKVTVARDSVALQLSRRLGAAVQQVQPASMERRAGSEYSFNDPLLAAVFEQPGFQSGDVIVALMFFAPGRHAGPTGDIARICDAAAARHPALRIRRTAPIGSHPLLLEILADRAREAIREGPESAA